MNTLRPCSESSIISRFFSAFFRYARWAEICPENAALRRFNPSPRNFLASPSPTFKLLDIVLRHAVQPHRHLNSPTKSNVLRSYVADSSCSICVNTFLASLAKEEIAQVMDSPAQPPELLGVTHLVDTCEHILPEGVVMIHSSFIWYRFRCSTYAGDTDLSFNLDLFGSVLG